MKTNLKSSALLFVQIIDIYIYEICDIYNYICFSLVLENSNMPAPIEALKSWKEYYEWRGFHLSSPIAMLMHHVLTIYHIIQVSVAANISYKIQN